MPRDIAAPCGLEHFLTRASAISGLVSKDIAGLLHLPNETFVIRNGQSLIALADPECVYLVAKGIVLQRSLTVDRRPVVGFFVPGEMANLPRTFGDASRSAFYACPDTLLHIVSRSRLLAATQQEPKLLRALAREIALEARYAQEWLVNVGSRRAAPRIARFFLDFSARLDRAGHDGQEPYALPFNQTLLSEMLGLSLVHTNKSYRSLYKAGLISIQNQRLRILDRDDLRRFAEMTYIPAAPAFRQKMQRPGQNRRYALAPAE